MYVRIWVLFIYVICIIKMLNNVKMIYVFRVKLFYYFDLILLVILLVFILYSCVFEERN